VQERFRPFENIMLTNIFEARREEVTEGSPEEICQVIDMASFLYAEKS